MNQTWHIARHEMQRSLRTRAVQGLGGLLLGLLIFCLLAGRSEYRKAQQERAAARQAMRDFFLGQGATNPHSAVHYGTFVFKPYSVLSVVDPGVEQFVGVTLRLEGHTQNEVQFAPGERSSSLLRFGRLSFTVLWQVVVPLVLIFVAHRTIVGERLAGTLPLLAAQGVSVRRLIWGKVLGYVGLMLGMLLVTGIALLVLQREQTEAGGGAWLLRLSCMLGAYAAYYVLLLTLTVYASARLTTPSQVLVLLLAGWFVWTVLLPKLAMSIGTQAYPLPSRIQFDENLQTAYQQGLNGHDPNDARAKRLQDSLLTHYGVKELSQLPVNADGILMQADETYHNRAYDQQQTQLRRVLDQQSQVARRVALFDPLLVVSHVSRGVAQTDLAHHFRFVQQAEAYRRWLIRKLNDKMAYGGSKTGDWEWQVSPDYWRGIRDFAYQPPSLAESLRPYRAELWALALWVLGTLGLVHWAAGRLRVV